MLLFEMANRGNHGRLAGFNGEGSTDPRSAAYFGDALLFREGYTIVWVGWEFDLSPGRLRLQAPRAVIPPGPDVEPLSVDIIVNTRVARTTLVDDFVRPPATYAPANPASADAALTVRDLFWNEPIAIPRARWRWVLDGEHAATRRARRRLRSGPLVSGHLSRLCPCRGRSRPRGHSRRGLRLPLSLGSSGARPLDARGRERRRRAASSVSSSTRDSTPTSATGAYSTASGRTLPARLAATTTADSRRPDTATCLPRRSFRSPTMTRPT